MTFMVVIGSMILGAVELLVFPFFRMAELLVCRKLLIYMGSKNGRWK